MTNALMVKAANLIRNGDIAGAEFALMSDQLRKLQVIDKRPFFEKALSHGVKHHILDQAKCRIIIADGAKGTVQVAAFFGTSQLHTDLENARLRVVNLGNLYLENSFDGDLQKAAESLCDNAFLSHSRGGNEMLKVLHAMPDSTVFADTKGQGQKEFQDERTLAKPFSLAAYRKERKARPARNPQRCWQRLYGSPKILVWRVPISISSAPKR